jgi:hypothetical protein
MGHWENLWAISEKGTEISESRKLGKSPILKIKKPILKMKKPGAAVRGFRERSPPEAFGFLEA